MAQAHALWADGGVDTLRVACLRDVGAEARPPPPPPPADHAAVARLHRLAFEGDAEARLVDALRRSGAATVSLVAEAEGRVVGHVLLSRLEAPENALALAPLAVLPDR